MEYRYASHPEDVKSRDTTRLRRDYLIGELFVPGRVKLVYTHVDRMIAGGVCPVEPIPLEAGAELRAASLLERREMGLINVGGPGTVTVDGTGFDLAERDGLYIGMGAREIVCASRDPADPAKFYCNSAPAHAAHPTAKVGLEQAAAVRLGSAEQSNARTIYKYIHPGGVGSCQLVMGLTALEPGSVWNSMPCHTHDRRMEVYFYFDLPEDAVVFHFMGVADETRHIVVRNEEAVISPSWSVHCGVGTANYAFIWGMAGENQEFSDMDGVPMRDLA